MRAASRTSGSVLRLRALAEFRHQLRQFLHFSEAAAMKVGLQPQQHQLLLQVAGAPEGVATTIGYVAERMGLRHNSVVELSKRCEDAGLVVRRHDDLDRRWVRLEITPKGGAVLESLAIDHAMELHELAPQLLRTLSDVRTAQDPGAPGALRKGRSAPVQDQNVQDQNVQDQNVQDQNVQDQNVQDQNVQDQNVQDQNVQDRNESELPRREC